MLSNAEKKKMSAEKEYSDFNGVVVHPYTLCQLSKGWGRRVAATLRPAWNAQTLSQKKQNK